MDFRLIQYFDDAIKTKNITSLYTVGLKIANIYSYRMNKEFKLHEDYEYIADELILNCIGKCKETNFSKDPKYYFAMLKTGAKFKYLSIYNTNPKIFSLEEITTNEYGENFIDYFKFEPISNQRDYKEEVETNICDKIIDLADKFYTRKQVLDILKIDRLIFNYICKKYGIQFYTGSTQRFLESMKVYNIYNTMECDIQKTRNFIKDNEIKLENSVSFNIRMAKEYLEIFHKNKKVFMNNFIYPPNKSTVFEKIG